MNKSPKNCSNCLFSGCYYTEDKAGVLIRAELHCIHTQAVTPLEHFCTSYKRRCAPIIPAMCIDAEGKLL